ncbi:MAG: O-antigen ligase family protein, partial [Patescibacteria group bacterium]|nr:O-antigen ligase family protein [Patescibacteria group bacterium]
FFKNKKTIIFFIFLAINILFSKNQTISLYQLLRIIELFTVFFIGNQIFKIIKEKTFLKILLISSLFQLLLSTLQIKFQHSLQGIFYFFGERLFSLSTPGIAKGNLNGIEFLRPYATFSHPNSLAGFFLLIYFFILTEKKFNQHFLLKNFILLISSILVFISFSKIAILSFLIINILFLIFVFKSKKSKKIICYPCFFSKIFVPFFVSLIFLKATTDPLTLKKRLELIKNSLDIILNNFIFGVGAGNYLLAQSHYFSKYPLFFNQPVHNIFLLFFSEFGIILGSLIIVLFFNQIKNLIKKNFFVFLAVFLTGLFDHYWWSLIQNRLILFFIYGIVSSSFLIFRFRSKS